MGLTSDDNFVPVATTNNGPVMRTNLGPVTGKGKRPMIKIDREPSNGERL